MTELSMTGSDRATFWQRMSHSLESVKARRHAPGRWVAISRMVGVRPALKLLSRKLLHRNQPQVVTHIRTPGCSSGMWVRPRSSDLDVVLQIFSKRDYDLSWCLPYKQHIEAICDRIRADGDVPLIVDAGANIGASTLWFSLHFPAAKVFAIEPDRANFEMLAKNTANRSNITLFNAGLWDKPTSLSILSDEEASWAKRVGEETSPAATIDSITIPELLKKEPRLRPLIVKIDIEGAETAVLRSNTEWIDEVPLVIFEPHDGFWHWLGLWQGTGHSFFSTLSRRKHEYLFRGENVFAFLHPNTA